MPDPTTRSGAALVNAAAEIRADFDEIDQHLTRALDLIRGVEAETKGVNGLSATLRSKGNEIEAAKRALQEEAEDVRRRLLGTGPAPATSVDQERRLAVVAAKEAAGS